MHGAVHILSLQVMSQQIEVLDCELTVVGPAVAAYERHVLSPLILDAMGEHAEAAAEQAIAEQRFGAEYPYDLAAYYARRGNADQAMRWLDKSCERRDPDLIRVGSDPLFRPLRANSHFLALLDRLKAASQTLDGR